MTELNREMTAEMERVTYQSYVQAYIIDMLAELSEMAQANGLSNSSYFIDVVQKVITDKGGDVLG